MNRDYNSLDLIWDDLRLFEKKILYGIACHIIHTEPIKKAYRLRLTEFNLDQLNPSDITERLKGLKNKSISMKIDQGYAQVPLLTDVRYDDPSKTVTITFNSLLKRPYELLAHTYHCLG